MSEEKKKIEAVLFTTGRFMTVEEISNVTGLTQDVVTNILTELKNEYDQKDSSLTIQQHENRFKLNIRKEYGSVTNKLVSTTEMDSPTTKTLAVIAFKNPALQSDIIKIRGNKAYDHITRLIQEGLISSEKHGRTRLLKLTPKFFDYFDTAEPAIKEKFKEIEDKYKAQEAAEKEQKEGEKVAQVQEVPQQESVRVQEQPVQEEANSISDEGQDTNL